MRLFLFVCVFVYNSVCVCRCVGGKMRGGGPKIIQYKAGKNYRTILVLGGGGERKSRSFSTHCKGSQRERREEKCIVTHFWIIIVAEGKLV